MPAPPGRRAFMFRRLSISFVAFALAGAALAGPGAAEILQPQDLFSLNRASDPRVRPDGGAVAYVRVTNDIMTDRGLRSIWLVDLKTGVQSPLAAGDAEAYAPRWSPDGTRVAFLSSRGDGAPELMVRWVASGQTAKVATLERPAADIAWSPDGKQLAFVMLQPEPDKTFGAPLKKPKDAHWSGDLKVITSVSYRADGRGDLENGQTHVFVAP